MPVAEIGFEQAAAKQIKQVANKNAVGGTRQAITSCLAARTLHESAAPQNTHNLAHVRNRDAFRPADLRNGQASICSLASQPQKAAQTIFFTSRKSHSQIYRNASTTKTLTEKAKLGGQHHAQMLLRTVRSLWSLLFCFFHFTSCLCGERVYVLTTCPIAASPPQTFSSYPTEAPTPAQFWPS